MDVFPWDHKSHTHVHKLIHITGSKPRGLERGLEIFGVVRGEE